MSTVRTESFIDGDLIGSSSLTLVKQPGLRYVIEDITVVDGRLSTDTPQLFLFQWGPGSPSVPQIILETGTFPSGQSDTTGEVIDVTQMFAKAIMQHIVGKWVIPDASAGMVVQFEGSGSGNLGHVTVSGYTLTLP